MRIGSRGLLYLLQGMLRMVPKGRGTDHETQLRVVRSPYFTWRNLRPCSNMRESVHLVRIRPKTHIMV